MTIKLTPLEGLTRLVAMNNDQLNTGCRAGKLPNEQNSFTQCYNKIDIDISLITDSISEINTNFIYIPLYICLIY